jgi:hypothetical protein
VLSFVDLPVEREKIFHLDFEIPSEMEIISVCAAYKVILWNIIMERMAPRRQESQGQGPCEKRLVSCQGTGERHHNPARPLCCQTMCQTIS